MSLSEVGIYTKGGGPRVVVSTAAFHARVRGSVPGLGGLKETKTFLPHPRVKVSIVGGLRDREVACSASDRQGSNFESCVWRTVSSQSSHHPQEVLLAQFSLYVHKGGLKPDSFHFYIHENTRWKTPKSSICFHSVEHYINLLFDFEQIVAILNFTHGHTTLSGANQNQESGFIISIQNYIKFAVWPWSSGCRLGKWLPPSWHFCWPTSFQYRT